MDTYNNALAKCLINRGLLTEPRVSSYSQAAENNQQSLSAYLDAENILSLKTLTEIVANEFGIGFLDLDSIDLNQLPLHLLPPKLILEHRVLPIEQQAKHLVIAITDPTQSRVIDEIKFHSRLNVEPMLVEEDKLLKAIEHLLAPNDSAINDLLTRDLDQISNFSSDENLNREANVEIDDAPIVRFVNKILLDSIKLGVSDIHIEPFENQCRIRFRHDGILSAVSNPPINIANRIISRIKVMAKMDIAERRIPQDGRIKLPLSKTQAIDFRVNSCPTLFGEKVVLRILDPNSAQLGIEKLGLEPIQQQHFLNAIHKPYGMVLVTGPTGSGKTVTLYSGLNILNSIERNISTAENPVEISVEGINQVNVNPKAGLTFAEALRAFLRQDPDIIMVGEIRDIETANIAIKAAQTGHLVLSTLHTNDAPQTINRLLQMGIEPFNIASSINLIVAQRLARRLCGFCKQVANYPEAVWLNAGFSQAEISQLTLYEAGGCEHCNHGYKGRIGIYQVLPISEAMRGLILNGGNALAMAEQAKREGIADLRSSGLLKVRQGITSLAEIDRVTQE